MVEELAGDLAPVLEGEFPPALLDVVARTTPRKTRPSLNVAVAWPVRLSFAKAAKIGVGAIVRAEFALASALVVHPAPIIGPLLVARGVGAFPTAAIILPLAYVNGTVLEALRARSRCACR